MRRFLAFLSDCMQIPLAPGSVWPWSNELSNFMGGVSGLSLKAKAREVSFILRCPSPESSLIMDNTELSREPLIILLVEDNPAHAELVRRNLQGHPILNKI